jgi:hypothetical protein
MGAFPPTHFQTPMSSGRAGKQVGVSRPPPWSGSTFLTPQDQYTFTMKSELHYDTSRLPGHQLPRRHVGSNQVPVLPCLR